MDPETYQRFKELVRRIEDSPGQKTINQIRRMQESLRLVRRNFKELASVIRAFDNTEFMLTIWAVENREKLDFLMEEVTRLLHNFLAAAFSLVEYMRHHRRELYPDAPFGKEIDEKIGLLFPNDPDHNVAQGLRNYALHYSLPPMNAKVTLNRIEAQAASKASGTAAASEGVAMQATSTFEVPIQLLLQWDGWNAKAKKALFGMGEGLNVMEFTERYFKKVESFYLWLWERQEEVHKKDIEATNQLKAQARQLSGE